MSLAALSWAKAQRTGSPTLKAVLLAVADYADENGVAWPSQQRLALDTELNDRTIRRALDDLEARGFLSRRKRPPMRDGTRVTDVLTLAIHPPVTESGRDSDHRTHSPKPPVTVSGKPSGNHQEKITSQEEHYGGKGPRPPTHAHATATPPAEGDTPPDQVPAWQGSGTARRPGGARPARRDGALGRPRSPLEDEAAEVASIIAFPGREAAR